MKIRSLTEDISRIVENNVVSGNVQEFFKKIPGSGFGGGYLQKFNQFFLDRRYICV